MIGKAMASRDDDYAIYLPAVNDSYAAETAGDLDPARPFPKELTLRDLVFWEPNELWYYPYLLHSVGLYSVNMLPDNAVSQRHRENSILVGDSGGYQIGKGTMEGLKLLQRGPMEPAAAVQAWKQEFVAREWIVDWLETHANYAMTIDMPLWAPSADGADSPFHRCSADQLIDMTVENLRFIERRSRGRTKWLNVVQGDPEAARIGDWWNAVKWFRRGGWAMAGSAGVKGGLANMLRALLMMRDEGAFEPGQDWVHVLGVSTPKWAVLLTAVQSALRQTNQEIRVSYDSSSPFQSAGRYEQVTVAPEFTADNGGWAFGAEKSPQSRLHVGQVTPFPHSQSPIGKRLQLGQLSVRDGKFEKRQYDAISNTLLANHNVWVYVDTMRQANYLAAARDETRVPRKILEAIALIEDLFGRGAWKAALAANASVLDAVAPSEYRQVGTPEAIL